MSAERMNAEMPHEELESLLGAYALNAVEDHERAAVEAHLSECDACSDELGQHLEVVGSLAGESTEVPGELWDRVAAQITTKSTGESEPAKAPLRFPRQPTSGGGTGRSLSARALNGLVGITAVAACAALIAGVVVVRQDSRLQKLKKQVDSPSIEQLAKAANEDPANRHVTLVSDDGQKHVDAVMLDSGQGFVVGSDLPDAGPGRGYQLWAGSAERMVSLGMIGPDVKTAVFVMPADAALVGLTNEEASGATSPTSAPLVVARVS